MKCEYCDNEVPAGSAKCPACGAAAKLPPPTPVAQFVSDTSTASQGATSADAFKAKIAYVPPYYQEEFTKISNSNGAYNGKWNWAAFFFSWIWGFTKGLVIQSIVALVVAAVLASFTMGFGGIAVSIWFATRGNKMYYEKLVNQKDVYS